MAIPLCSILDTISTDSIFGGDTMMNIDLPIDDWVPDANELFSSLVSDGLLDPEKLHEVMLDESYTSSEDSLPGDNNTDPAEDTLPTIFPESLSDTVPESMQVDIVPLDQEFYAQAEQLMLGENFSPLLSTSSEMKSDADLELNTEWTYNSVLDDVDKLNETDNPEEALFHLPLELESELKTEEKHKEVVFNDVLLCDAPQSSLSPAKFPDNCTGLETLPDNCTGLETLPDSCMSLETFPDSCTGLETLPDSCTGPATLPDNCPPESPPKPKGDSLEDHNYFLTQNKLQQLKILAESKGTTAKKPRIDVWNDDGLLSPPVEESDSESTFPVRRYRRTKTHLKMPVSIKAAADKINYERGTKRAADGPNKSPPKRRRPQNSVETTPPTSEFYDSEESNAGIPKKKRGPQKPRAASRKVALDEPGTSSGRAGKRSAPRKTIAKKGHQKKAPAKPRGASKKPGGKVSKSESQRLAHNLNEKMRRTMLTKDLHVLRDLVPHEYYDNLRNNNREKASKQKILTAAQAYVEHLIKNGHSDGRVHRMFTEHHYSIQGLVTGNRALIKCSIKKFLAKFVKLRGYQYRKQQLRKYK